MTAIEIKTRAEAQANGYKTLVRVDYYICEGLVMSRPETDDAVSELLVSFGFDKPLDIEQIEAIYAAGGIWIMYMRK